MSQNSLFATVVDHFATSLNCMPMGQDSDYDGLNL